MIFKYRSLKNKYVIKTWVLFDFICYIGSYYTKNNLSLTILVILCLGSPQHVEHLTPSMAIKVWFGVLNHFHVVVSTPWFSTAQGWQSRTNSTGISTGCVWKWGMLYLPTHPVMMNHWSEWGSLFFRPIWRSPEMGVPQHHPLFISGKTQAFWGSPVYGTPHKNPLVN